MNATPAVDLSPLAHMLLAGLVFAAIAVAFLWLRNRQLSSAGWRRTLTVLTLFLTFDLIVFGAFTRLTDSGLGCPDWPGCYGSATPVGAKAEIHAAQSAMPTGPVTHQKAWIEMVHRYLATGVGALILILAVMGWRGRSGGRGRAKQASPPGSLGPGLPTVTLLWVCIQGAFGAFTVTMKLFPAIVTLHLLGGLVLLALLGLQAERLQRLDAGHVLTPLDGGTRSLLIATFVLLGVQVTLGGWVSTNYAVLACTDFPTCHGSLWPEMRFDQAFQLWRERGMTADGELLSLAALTAIHYVHRLMAYVVLAAMAWLAWRLRKVEALRTQQRSIAWLAALQLATGLSNVVLGWPLIAALLHTGGAAALVLVLTWTVAATQRASVAQPRAVARPTLDLST